MAIHNYNNPQYFPCGSKTREQIKAEIDKTTGNCMDENVLDILVNRIEQIISEKVNKKPALFKKARG